MNDQQIEQEIQAKGLTAPRVTPADLEANIASEHYFTAGQGVSGEVSSRDEQPYQFCYESSLDLLTFCVLVLKNGFTVTGESACASPENFDPEVGRKRLSARFGGHDFSHLPLDTPLRAEDFPKPDAHEAARSRTEVIVGIAALTVALGAAGAAAGKRRAS